MSNENQYYDLLHAYALGCLDPKDLNILNEFLDTGEEFFWEELGEYQNLAALLPSILNIETPGMELKDKVARKLYNLRNEKRTKAVEDKIRKTIEKEKTDVPDLSKLNAARKEERLSSLFSRTRIQMKEMESGQDNYKQLSEIDNNEEASNQIRENEFEPVITREKIPIIEEKSLHEIDNQSQQKETIEGSFTDEFSEIDTGGITEEEIKIKPEPKEKKSYNLHGIDLKPEPYPVQSEKSKKASGGVIVAIVLFLIVAAGLFYFYSKITSDVNAYKSGIEKLDSQLKDLSSKLTDNQEIQKILQSKNVKIVNLSGTDISRESYGKLIISFDTDKGYLQFSNMPQLPENNVFQLWVIINKKFVSLGMVEQTNKNFYSFTLPELTNTGKTVFLVSKEPSAGSLKPSKDIYLTGTLE